MANVIRPLKDLRDEFLSYLDEAGDTGTTKTNANYWLNQAHFQRCTSRDWPFMLWDQNETVTLVANQRFYPLHQEFFRPLYLFNRETKSFFQEVPTRQLTSTGALWNTDTGRSNYFRFSGRTGIQYQPTSASVVTIVSTSASDNTSTYNIIVRGMTTSGVTTETITPSGLTPVAGTTSFTKLLNVTKAAAWNGTMTMTSNSAAVTNLKLFASEYGRSYQQIELLSLPPSADVIEYQFYRLPSPLTNDYDVPDIPPPFQNILVFDALMLLAGYNTDIRGTAMNVWSGQRTQLEDALEHAYAEGQTLDALPRFVRTAADESIVYGPRVYSGS